MSFSAAGDDAKSAGRDWIGEFGTWRMMSADDVVEMRVGNVCVIMDAVCIKDKVIGGSQSWQCRLQH